VFVVFLDDPRTSGLSPPPFFAPLPIRPETPELSSGSRSLGSVHPGSRTLLQISFLSPPCSTGKMCLWTDSPICSPRQTTERFVTTSCPGPYPHLLASFSPTPPPSSQSFSRVSDSGSPSRTAEVPSSKLNSNKPSPSYSPARKYLLGIRVEFS